MVRQLLFLFLLLKSATARDRTVMKLQADGSVLECTMTKNGKERCIDTMNPMMVLGNEEHILRQQTKEREKMRKAEEEMKKEKENQRNEATDVDEEESSPPKKGMDLNALLNSPEAKRQIKQALDSGEQVDLSAIVGSTISRAFANLGKPAVQEEEDDDDGPSGVELLMSAALRAAAQHASGDPFQNLSNHSRTDQCEFFNKVAKVLSRFNDPDLDMELFLQDLISIATPDHVEGDPIELENIVRTKQKLKDTLQHLLGQLGLQYFHPLQLYYYMIDEEIRKNSVWKRHRHRYLPPVSKEEVLQMIDGLYLSQLAYSKNCNTIQRHVEQFQIDPVSGNSLWTLRNCSVHSERFHPAHYMMVQHSKSSMPLEVALIIRGSQQQADYLSAGALHAVPYRGGFVHEGVRNSAQWIRGTYENDLQQLLQEHRQTQSNKKVPLKLYLMGHSLGGATASVASMEFNDVAEFEAFAVGFGSPASLSPNLSRTMKDRITSVVNDADCVPRMSAKSIVDAWKRVLQFDFTSLCLDDVNQLEPILRSKLSILGNWTESMLNSMQTTVEDKIRKEAKKQLSHAQKVLVNASSDPYESLVPAGDCVHFYRDGTSWQSVYIDCQQFYEIEVVPHMIDDHLVAGGYYHGMLAYLRKLDKDTNFRPLHEVDSLRV
ncbi:hypothetical protein FisN_22Lh039 [Fistulifera solaris]|uniref:Fungal lipase-type domain-containing protein n=1 Tax=Fistulifera solaris TaxID=1519565 RepID=A0A1Z5JBN7_FISSO|nr:hypothetical protein FisN_22Lh039 [Fistulifera solaris]|eukprot:GAX11369.1 hypothetical protein FisN_22Lh039 [Fistulifera solaris]